VQILQHSRAEFRTAPGRVEIIVPQDQRSTGCLCSHLRDPESAGVTEVKEAGRRWRKTPAILGVRSHGGYFVTGFRS
jgi:hypothetical protein